MSHRMLHVARLVGLALLASAGACRAQPVDSTTIVKRARGVYVILGPQPGQDRNPRAVAALASPVNGVYLRTLWSRIEPRPGAYDWTALDADIATARKAGKRISLGIRAGESTPAWLLDRVKTASFVVGLRHGTVGNCEQIRIALPWDTGYTAEYGRMMSALSRHLKDTNAYASVTIVKLTGLNSRTEELHLPTDRPAERKIAAGQACRVSDAPAIWRQVGYRPALVFDAWKSLAKSVGDAFPDKLLSLPILTNGDFPKVDADGRPVARDAAAWVDLKDQIIRAGVQMFPGRFAVQRTGLNNRGMSPIIAEAKQLGAVFGMQSNHRGGPGGGAGCDLVRGARNTPCSAESYRSTLAMGERAGATFLEIWPVDAAKFGAQVGDSVKAMQ